MCDYVICMMCTNATYKNSTHRRWYLAQQTVYEAMEHGEREWGGDRGKGASRSPVSCYRYLPWNYRDANLYYVLKRLSQQNYSANVNGFQQFLKWQPIRIRKFSLSVGTRGQDDEKQKDEQNSVICFKHPAHRESSSGSWGRHFADCPG